MTALPALLAGYAAYHRDPRNRLTHYVGVPLIIYSVLLSLVPVGVQVLDVRIPIGWLLVAGLALFYVCLDLRLGLCLAAALALLVASAELTGQVGRSVALVIAGSGFLVGWALQLWGHRLEGNRPALLDNLGQIFIAPLYLAAELGFALGLRASLQDAVAAQRTH